jgi:hypothetical protein
MQENIDAEILNQNRTARTRLWQLMKDARAPMEAGAAKRRA